MGYWASAVVILSLACLATGAPLLATDIASLKPKPNETAFPAGSSAEMGRFKPGTRLTIRTDEDTGELILEIPITSATGDGMQSRPKVEVEEVQATGGGRDSKKFDGYRPMHLNSAFMPDIVEGDDNSTEGPVERKIFSPDERFFYHSSSYPWTTVGRLAISGGGWCSGTMIGPRHVLTAAHCVFKSPGVSHNWLRFTPCAVDSSAPFGHAFARRVLWTITNHDHSDDLASHGESAYDVAVLILDKRLGETTGWVGSRRYKSEWNGGKYWQSIGYPGDKNMGLRPFLENDAVVDSARSFGRGLALTTKNDIWGGQSGGPTWGYWDDDEGPRVVGVHSTCGNNNCSNNRDAGGSNMLRVINRARDDYP